MYSTYITLLDAGWRMQEIDEMDMLGFLKLRAWNARRKHDRDAPEKQAYIDQVWPGMRTC